MSREIEVTFSVTYRTKVSVDDPSFNSIADAVEIPEVEGVDYVEDTFEVQAVKVGDDFIYDPQEVDDYFAEESRRDQKRISD